MILSFEKKNPSGFNSQRSRWRKNLKRDIYNKRLAKAQELANLNKKTDTQKDMEY